MEDIDLQKMKREHRNFSRQMAAEWGVGDNGEKIGTGFKNGGKEEPKEAAKKDEPKTWIPKPPEKFEPIDAEFKDVEGSKDLIKHPGRERADKIENLKQELDKARKEYLEMDHKKRGMWDRVNRFFGRGMTKDESGKQAEKVQYKRTESGNIAVDDQDVVYVRALYENKLFDYKNAMLEDAKASGVTNERLGQIISEIAKETTVNLAQDHNDIKFEHTKDRWDGRLGKGLIKMAEWYNKQPKTVKYGIAGALFLGGAVSGSYAIAGVAGAAKIATAFGIGSGIRRIFCGVVAGTGATLWLGERTKAKRETQTEKEATKFEKKMEKLEAKSEGNLSEEEKLVHVESLLKEKIFGVDDSLGSIKNKSLRNVAVGGVTVGIISSGALGYVMRELHVGEYVGKGLSRGWGAIRGLFAGHSEHLVPSGGGATGIIAPEARPGPSTTEVPKMPGTTTETPSAKPAMPETPKTAPEIPKTAEAPRGRVLEVGKWSGRGHSAGTFDGTLKKDFIDHGMDRTGAGHDAANVRLEFSKFIDKLKAEGKMPKNFSLDKIHPGAKIELSADGKHVIGFQDGPGGRWWQGHVHNAWSETEHPAHHPSGAPAHEAVHPAENGSGKGTIIPEKSVNPPIEHPSGQDIPPSGTRAEDIARPSARGLELYNKYAFEWNDNEITRATKIVKQMSLDDRENWLAIKNFTFSGFKENVNNPDLIKRVDEIRKAYIAILGPDAKPLSKETISRWIVRITKDSMKEKIYQAA